jgi:hypothetical protein
MQKVILQFPNATNLSAFILQYGLKQPQVNWNDYTLKGSFAEDIIIAACTSYDARLKKISFFK